MIGAITAIGSAAGGILSGVDGLLTSDEERLDAETRQKLADLKILAQQMQPQIMQLQIAQAQAHHPSWFVAGARPAFDWILNIGVAYGLIVAPFVNWGVGLAAWAAGVDSLPGFVHLPALDWEVIASAGGLRVGSYGWRAWEKRGGVARENMQAPSPPPPTNPITQQPSGFWPNG